MPVEVIDLLSSPEAAPPSRSQPPPPRPASTPRPKSDAALAVQQHWGLETPQSAPKTAPKSSYDDDIFDLTDPTVLSFLRSPLPTTMSRKTAPVAKSKSPKASRANDFLFLSDDFDTTVDLSEPISDPRPSKKQRVESSNSTGTHKTNDGPSDRTIQRSASGHVQGPAVVRQPLGSRQWNSSLDPIQTSSDPFASPTREAPIAKAKQTFIDLSKDDDDDDDDRFASPLPVNKGKDRENIPVPTGARPPPSSPLFVSSPLQELDESPQRKTISKNKAKEPLPWDHISSSAPETTLQDDQPDANTSRSGLKSSRSDINDFDLGDLAKMPWTSDDESLPDINDLRKSKSASSRGNSIAAVKRATAPKKSAAEKELEKTDREAAREAEKRRKQKERDDAKETKRLEKERAAALTEVNKVRTDKKISTPEMIVDLPASLKSSLKLQIETLLEDLSVKCHSYPSPVKDVIKWRRKIKARFNEDEGYWEPIPERIEKEKHAMVIMPAAEFVELALGPKGSDLEAHILKLQSNYQNETLIYLIEGLVPWMRKNRTIRNRQFTSAVRNLGAEPDPTAAADAASPPSTQRSRKRDPKPPPLYIDEDSVEDALLQLQVAHGALVHHTASPIETAQWVTIFTQHISTIPYRKQKDAANSSAAFCMDSGQVRTGDGAQDTYIRMLQEIVRVTPPMAYGIANKFPSVSQLVKGFQREGPLALEGIKKSANKDGAFTDRVVGQAISRRVHKVFTGADEDSTDI